jgi:hypothetical protein
VKEVDRVLFKVSALVIVANHHSNILMASHGLHLAVSEAKTERPGDGRPPQVMGGERLFAFIGRRARFAQNPPKF